MLGSAESEHFMAHQSWNYFRTTSNMWPRYLNVTDRRMDGSDSFV